MTFLSGKEFRLLEVRFQFIAESELPVQGFMTKLEQVTDKSWTVSYSKGEGFPIFLTIMLTKDNLTDISDDFFNSMFPEKSYDKNLCIFKIDDDIDVLDRRWYKVNKINQ